MLITLKNTDTTGKHWKKAETTATHYLNWNKWPHCRDTDDTDPCTTATNTHRKCNKALSGEIIFSPHVLMSMLLRGTFLEFAGVESYRCTTCVKKDSTSAAEQVYTKHFSCVTHRASVSYLLCYYFRCLAVNMNLTFFSSAAEKQPGFSCKMSPQYLTVWSQTIKYITYVRTS